MVLSPLMPTIQTTVLSRMSKCSITVLKIQCHAIHHIQACFRQFLQNGNVSILGLHLSSAPILASMWNSIILDCHEMGSCFSLCLQIRARNSIWTSSAIIHCCRCFNSRCCEGRAWQCGSTHRQMLTVGVGCNGFSVGPPFVLIPIDMKLNRSRKGMQERSIIIYCNCSCWCIVFDQGCHIVIAAVIRPAARIVTKITTTNHWPPEVGWSELGKSLTPWSGVKWVGKITDPWSGVKWIANILSLSRPIWHRNFKNCDRILQIQHNFENSKKP